MSTLKVTNIQHASATNVAMVLDTAGTVKAYSTISVGNVTPSSSGAGITFPATQSASSDANTLDDYEEGTWTPTANNVTVNSGTPSYSGLYTKIGNVVTILIKQSGGNITLSSSSYFGSLPFTVKSTWSSSSAYTCTGTLNSGIGYPFEGSTNIYIAQPISSGTATTLRFFATYYV